ncbi:hypothetical protein [Aliivibrio logei]|uniref:Uncharacterized protein n=1 Tax=Aliivibrio logei 5S-186 TaxID=626086 RepID=A0ABX3AU49_ALILO|nr:hypothetical protein [Aliivibrio logei]OEF12745.1 hypothetical protein A1Q5_08495 [Aliivibrio logei 5S-186]
MGSVEFENPHIAEQYKFDVLRDTTQFLITILSLQDKEMMILKTHLYCEKAMESIIELSFPKPEKILSSKMTFHNKLTILEAIYGNSSKNAEDFVLIANLNSVRNKLVHQLDAEELKKLLDKLLRKIKVNPVLIDKVPRGHLGDVPIKLADIYGRLLGLRVTIFLNK